MDIFKRILNEFWIPAVIAVGWTLYNLSTKTSTWDIRNVVNIFGPSFFLASWATAQVFRIRKQANVDKNLSTIETRLINLVDKLEQHTEDFCGYATGSDSVAFFIPMITSPNIVELALQNTSKYPVFDIYSELIDLDEPIDPQSGKFWTRHRFVLEHLYPNKIRMSAYRFNLSSRDKLSINVFIHTRTQGLTQQFRMRKVDGRFIIAIKTTSGEDVIERKVPANFPGYDLNNEDSIFK